MTGFSANNIVKKDKDNDSKPIDGDIVPGGSTGPKGFLRVARRRATFVAKSVAQPIFKKAGSKAELVTHNEAEHKASMKAVKKRGGKL